MKDPAAKLLLAYVGAVVLVLAVMVLSSLRCNAQQFKIKDHAPAAVAVFAAGCFEGAMDGLQFHYDKSNDFWNPDISWIRKYKNRDVAQGRTFAGKYFVWTTDGWHLMKAGRNVSIFTGFMLHVRTTQVKKRWYWYVLEGAGYWAINRAGFNLVYSLYK